MLGSSPRARVFAYAKPADLRKSFDTLSYLVASELGQEVLSGDYFVFVNRRLNRTKVLFFDGTGLCIFQKRLEKGHFACPWSRSAESAMTISMSELSLFLEGSRLVFLGALSPVQKLKTRVVEKALSV